MVAEHLVISYWPVICYLLAGLVIGAFWFVIVEEFG